MHEAENDLRSCVGWCPVRACDTVLVCFGFICINYTAFKSSVIIHCLLMLAALRGTHRLLLCNKYFLCSLKTVGGGALCTTTVDDLGIMHVGLGRSVDAITFKMKAEKVSLMSEKLLWDLRGNYITERILFNLHWCPVAFNAPLNKRKAEANRRNRWAVGSALSLSSGSQPHFHCSLYLCLHFFFPRDRWAF